MHDSKIITQQMGKNTALGLAVQNIESSLKFFKKNNLGIYSSLFVLQDLKSEKPRFKEYYQTLPKDKSILPIFYSDDEIKML